jgi:hypothetical protein
MSTGTLPITPSVLYGQGTDRVDGSRLAFVARGPEQVTLAPGADHDLLILAGGGTALLGGSHTMLTGAGRLAVIDASAGGHNNFDLTPAVTAFAGAGIQASDSFTLHGFTQADIAAGFEHARQPNPQTELLTIRHGGRAIDFAFSYGPGSQPPRVAQFHAV